jgi:hypothetical protein
MEQLQNNLQRIIRHIAEIDEAVTTEESRGEMDRLRVFYSRRAIAVQAMIADLDAPSVED